MIFFLHLILLGMNTCLMLYLKKKKKKLLFFFFFFFQLSSNWLIIIFKILKKFFFVLLFHCHVPTPLNHLVSFVKLLLNNFFLGFFQDISTEFYLRFFIMVGLFVCTDALFLKLKKKNSKIMYYIVLGIFFSLNLLIFLV